MAPPSVPASSLARETIVSSTRSKSNVEEIARPTSPSACSSPTERVSSVVRACSSVKSRTFSIAMTAWSAKVWSSAICLSVNGRTSARRMVIAPIAAPSRMSGAVKWVRQRPRALMAACSGYSWTAAGSSTSAM